MSDFFFFIFLLHLFVIFIYSVIGVYRTENNRSYPGALLLPCGLRAQNSDQAVSLCSKSSNCSAISQASVSSFQCCINIPDRSYLKEEGCVSVLPTFRTGLLPKATHPCSGRWASHGKSSLKNTFTSVLC